MTMTHRTGLTVGKFYPPHKGHHHLIDTALAACERTIVLVCDGAHQDIPAAVRAEWLREAHPAADVRVIPDIGKDDDSEAWGAHTTAFLGEAPDAVFTSEAYGGPYAEAMDALHVSVDPARTAFPVSGTAVRKDPYAQWAFLSPAVRAHYAKRVVILGAESTGTTTLAKALAAQYGTVWVPEYGRWYAAGKYTGREVDWRTDEFLHIARAQNTMMESLVRSAEKILFSDTDPFATTLWHERFMGTMSAELAEASKGFRKPDLYLLTGDEIPFEQDGLRDGGPSRHAMHRRFEEEIPKTGVPWLLLRGPHDVRLSEAVRAVDALFAGDGRA